MTHQKKIRVAQWATGTVGVFAMRAVIEHPAMELVGVHVYSEDKEGRDAGELCGLEPTGIRATRDREVILAAKPGSVIYMPDRTDLDDVCVLLENGVNIVTTRADFFNPAMMETAVRERVEAACRVGDATLHATGSSPGFITEVLPIALTSLSRRLDFFAVEEYANCLAGCSEEMLTELMGFGDTPEAFARRHNPEHKVFEYSLGLLADALGMPIDRFEHSVEAAYCRKPTELHRATIAAGTVGAQRVAVTGIHQGKPLLRFRSNWFVTTEVEPAWELRPDGWRVDVEGDTPMTLYIDLPMPQEERFRASARYTAHRPVNAIPVIVAAPSGIIPTTELSQVIAQLGVTS